MKYTEVCEAQSKEEMQRRFEELLTEVAAKHGGTPESHRATQLSNVGYFSGYYSAETFGRVNEWLGASHPIFGGNYPLPETAHALGRKAATEGHK